jgi:hypothetical protein
MFLMDAETQREVLSEVSVIAASQNLECIKNS